MVEKTLRDLISRMDLIQEGIWKTEEQVVQNLANVAKLRGDINAMQSKINLIIQILNKIDLELRGLKHNGTNTVN